MTADDAVTDGGEVYVFADQTVVDTEALRILFDALCSSMDFGSGFLDTEEVEALRSIAEDLGVNPMTATPSEFKLQYAHDFEASDAPKERWRNIYTGEFHESPEDFADRVARTVAKCRHCEREFDRAKHTPREVGA